MISLTSQNDNLHNIYFTSSDLIPYFCILCETGVLDIEPGSESQDGDYGWLVCEMSHKFVKMTTHVHVHDCPTIKMSNIFKILTTKTKDWNQQVLNNGLCTRNRER